MSKQLRVYREGAKTEFDYQILWEEDFTKLADAVKPLNLTCGKICIVADDTVAGLYGEEVQKALESLNVTVDLYTFPAGESSKNLDTVKDLYAFLIEHHYTRKDILAALGGGVTGDLTGYAAATYLRGVDFIQIPTTLLAQVDSSVGGKTGVDFEQYKNMVGAFHQPRLVYMNLNTLKSLPDDQFASGMGEVLKSGLIRDARFYEWTINHMSEIQERIYPVLVKMVRKCCEIKAAVVESDPTEQGERALLNLGHTVGHAFESLALAENRPVLHGYAVAWGIVCELYLSHLKTGFPKEKMRQTIQFIKENYGSFTFDCKQYEQLYALMLHDKKNTAGVINFTLLKEIGDISINQTADKDQIFGMFDFYRECMGI